MKITGALHNTETRSAGDDLLEEVLNQFSLDLAAFLPDNDNFPPELPAMWDPSTYEFEERDTNNG